MKDDRTRVRETGKSHIWPRAARERSRRRSLEQAIKIVEEGNLTPQEQRQVAKLRHLMSELDRPKAD